MTLVVSISQFRQNIADYLVKIKDGYTVILKDEKKGQEVAQLVSNRQFNPQSFERALRGAFGIFTSENHPEWKTKENVVKWVQKGRKAADRKF